MLVIFRYLKSRLRQLGATLNCKGQPFICSLSLMYISNGNIWRMKYFYSDIQCIHIFVTRSKTNDHSNSNPFTNQRIINGFEIKTSQWAVTSKSPRIFFQTAWPQALETAHSVLFNFCEVKAEGYICLDQCLTGFALIYLDRASPLFTSGRFVPCVISRIASICLACVFFLSFVVRKVTAARMLNRTRKRKW